jgi:16S rRNA (guanine527-N7)-methyltransferase
MRPGRILELLDPFLSPCPEPSRTEPAALSATQLSQISTYIDLLLRWNARINLTAIRTEEEIVTRHFGESLFAARHLFSPAPYPVSSSVPPVLKGFEVGVEVGVEVAVDLARQSPIRVADLGSGAGFPGIPLKLWSPNIKLTLIESNQKKATFLREVVRTLTLTDIDIQNTRAETIPHTYDVVILRAVDLFSTILPTAARLTAPSGCLALLIAHSQLATARQALSSFAFSAPLQVPQSDSRLLVIATREPSK